MRAAFGESRDFRLKVGLTGAGQDLFAIPPEFFDSNEVIALALGAARWVLLDPATAEGDGPGAQGPRRHPDPGVHLHGG